MKQLIRNHKKVSVGLFIIIVLLLLVANYVYQANSAVAYLTGQNCGNSSSYAASEGVNSCATGDGIKFTTIIIGVHYSYITLGSYSGTSSGGVAYGCEGELASGPAPNTYTGNIISFLGIHFVFDAKTSAPQGTGSVC